MKAKQNPRDEQTAQTGKVANDHNKVGEQELTQKNQAKRTPDSRAEALRGARPPPGANSQL